jgi:quercetin dioxygenase-like cupin family protein
MNAWKRGLLVGGTLIALALAAGVFVGVGGMAVARPDEKETAKPISAWDIVEKLDGKEAKATVVEVTLEPGQAGEPHRHPGPVIGYVLEGEYEWAIDDQPAKTLKAGDTFYEPTGCLHRVSKNPAAKGNTRVLAVVLHPRDARQITIPEPKK